MWGLIVSVPDHCLSFYFVKEKNAYGGMIEMVRKPSQNM